MVLCCLPLTNMRFTNYHKRFPPLVKLSIRFVASVCLILQLVFLPPHQFIFLTGRLLTRLPLIPPLSISPRFLTSPRRFRRINFLKKLPRLV